VLCRRKQRAKTMVVTARKEEDQKDEECAQNRIENATSPWDPPATLALSSLLCWRKRRAAELAEQSHQNTLDGIKKRIYEHAKAKDISRQKALSSARTAAGRHAGCDLSTYSSHDPDSPMATLWDPYRELRRRIVGQIIAKNMRGTQEGLDLLHRMRQRASATTRQEIHGLNPVLCVEVIDSLTRDLYPNGIVTKTDREE